MVSLMIAGCQEDIPKRHVYRHGGCRSGIPMVSAIALGCLRLPVAVPTVRTDLAPRVKFAEQLGECGWSSVAFCKQHK